VGDFWVEMALSVVFAVLREVVKNPTRKAALKKAMVKLRNVVTVAYPPDQD
jgi:predicted solute-binding protein